jgi:hypothetical protein
MKQSSRRKKSQLLQSLVRDKILKKSWALFIGLLLIITAYGLQENLLGLGLYMKSLV